MIICFECAKEGKTALDSLVQSGKFRDAGEVITMALVNYEVLHRAMADGRGLVTSGSLIVQDAESTSHPVETRVPAGSALAAAAPLRVPAIFSLKITTLEGLDLPPVENATAPDSLSPKGWLWGQYNRFLPAKATCRALLNLNREHPTGLPVDQAANKISYEACVLGDVLASSDQLYRRSRELALGAAFPTTGINGGESRSRFQTQFVAALKQNKLTGLPAELRLVTTDTSKEAHLRLTAAGAAFAVLPNPILDGEPATGGRKWTDTETRFLLDHIKRAVPVEASAYAAIIEGIEAGENTPDKLDAYLRRRFGLQGANEIKPTFLSTQRTGVVSRMADLDLLYREKSGLRVTYSLTHIGQHFGSQFK
jgi:hypothetical protein